MSSIVYRATETASAVYIERIAELTKARTEAGTAFLTRHGFPENTNFWGTERTFTGLDLRPDSPPSGWRIDSREGVLMPDKRTKKGKEIAKEMAAIPFQNQREALPGGMPQVATAKDMNSFLQPGSSVIDGRLYVTWPAPLRQADANNIDPQVWEQIPLSSYYLAQEKANDT